MNKSELAKGIKKLGLGPGDIVMLHASLGSIGYVDGGAETLVAAFLEVLGPKGTLVAPTFGTGAEVFDPATNPTGLGAVAETVRRHARAVRSRSPLGTISAIGAKAQELVRDHEKAPTVHGEGTPYTRIAQLGGYVVLLGVDLDRCTMLHSAEALCEMPYLSTQTRKYLDAQGNVQTGTYRFYPGPHRDFIGLDRHLRDKGIIRLSRLGNAVVRIAKAKPFVEEVVAMLKKDLAAVLCDNPSCEDCVTQRAAIYRWRSESEAFRLTASSHIAGRTTDDMIASLNAAGIEHVEMSIVNGKDIALLQTGDLRNIAKELSAAGITVSSVSSRLWQNSFPRVLDACQSLEAQQVVLPLLSGLEAKVSQALDRGLTVLLRNGAVTGQRASEIFAAYPNEALLSFDPLGFVLTGEYPFRKSVKMKARFRIGELCVCDATWAGRAMPLARGNAEIKELVSILRCRSFSGDMLLTWPIEQPAPDFRQIVQSFFSMLESL